MKFIKRSGFEFADWEARSFYWGEIMRARWCIEDYRVKPNPTSGYRYIIVVVRS